MWRDVFLIPSGAPEKRPLKSSAQLRLPLPDHHDLFPRAIRRLRHYLKFSYIWVGPQACLRSRWPRLTPIRLFGALSIQAYLYWCNNDHDHPRLKAHVGFVMSVEFYGRIDEHC